jgi:DNA helicase HerA-like ATPase
MEDADGPLLYQVAGLSLEEETWSGSSAIVPRAKLVQVGAVDPNGVISARPSLPRPYQAIHTAKDTSADLSDAFFRIGNLKGTAVPVGIRKEWLANNGHLAILGMSGMGKTTVASKLAQLAGATDKFVILDETSEYRTRLDFQVEQIGNLDWDAGGISVCEPGGELPAQCEKLIKAAMTAAQAEYATGNTPKRRFILLEEAHGWLPEWNFATRNNLDSVNASCRYILQARKFNLTFIMVSQRTAVISKSAISQCENYIILRTLDQTSLEYVEGVVGQELKSVISELGKYEAVCVGPLFNSDAPIIVSLDPSDS